MSTTLTPDDRQSVNNYLGGVETGVMRHATPNVVRHLCELVNALDTALNAAEAERDAERARRERLERFIQAHADEWDAGYAVYHIGDGSTPCGIEHIGDAWKVLRTFCEEARAVLTEEHHGCDPKVALGMATSAVQRLKTERDELVRRLSAPASSASSTNANCKVQGLNSPDLSGGRREQPSEGGISEEERSELRAITSRRHTSVIARADITFLVALVQRLAVPPSAPTRSKE